MTTNLNASKSAPKSDTKSAPAKGTGLRAAMEGIKAAATPKPTGFVPGAPADRAVFEHNAAIDAAEAAAKAAASTPPAPEKPAPVSAVKALTKEEQRAARAARWEKTLPAIEGATIVKRISPRMTLIERVMVIEALKLTIPVTLYHCTCDEISYETKNRADAVAWLKANQPAKRSGGSSAPRSPMVNAERAARLFTRFNRAMGRITATMTAEEHTAMLAALKTLNDLLVAAHKA
jgi:hypothetical protein